MKTSKLGPDGPEVSVIGLSCLAMSDAVASDDEGIATIHAAVDGGVTLLDTGDFYGVGGHNETLVREALWSVRRRERLLIAVRFGVQRAPDGALLGMDARPPSVKNFLTYSLHRLGIDYVDLYSPACDDPSVPVEDTVGAIADLVAAGYVRYIGLSNVAAGTIRRAHAVHPITAVQAEYSLFRRSAERELLPTLRELGIGLVARDGGWSHRLLGSAMREAERPREESERAGDGACSDADLALLTTLDEIAAERDVTPIRVALAWVIARGEHIVPLVAARGPGEIADALGARSVKLSGEEMACIETAAPMDAPAFWPFADVHAVLERSAHAIS
jgi:aryl-alcohol dehydrogenase-like predicted oxidoreductase